MFRSKSPATITPVITFHGPFQNDQITAVNSSGQEVAHFTAQGTKAHFTISRFTSPTTAPVTICAGSKSSWTEDRRLLVHGTELKLKWDNPLGEEARVKVPGVLGKLEWKEESGFSSLSKYKLVDSSKNIVARASTKERRCEVFVPGDEVLFDNILSLWVAYLLYHKKDALKGGTGGGSGNDVADLKATAKIFQALGDIASADES